MGLKRFGVRVIGAAAAILVALLALVAPAQAQGVSGTVSVITLRPLSILKMGDLDFGTLVSTPTAGTVSVDPVDDGRTTTGGVIAGGGAPRAARFLSYGTAGSILYVTRGQLPTLTRSGGGGSMPVTALTLNGPVLRVVNPAGVLDLRVGATMSVGANQAAGVYTGSFDINVNYY